MHPVVLAARAAGHAGRLLLHLPPRVQARLGGPAPAAAPDLLPEARLLARVAARVEAPAPDDPLTVGSRRSRAAFTAQAVAIAGPVPFAGRIEERTVADLRARLYVPAAAATPSPLLLFLHGGGWVRGDADSHDAPCRVLAGRAGVRVLSLEYRMAPEHVWPAAADDVLAAWRAITDDPDAFGADPARLAVGGDSAGGNLAAVLCLDAREHGLRAPAFQLLVYPGTDFVHKRASVRSFREGFLLSEADMDRYKALYVPEERHWSDPRASPLRAPDLSGLPPALVVTAAADPLRDEGEAYAAALEAAGTPARVHRHPHLHGFLNLTGARGARAGIDLAADALREALAPR